MSVNRHCLAFKAVDGQYYLELGQYEDCEQGDSLAYGPFACMGAVRAELLNHSNPGSLPVDEFGSRPVPSQSPNGMPLEGHSGAVERIYARPC